MTGPKVKTAAPKGKKKAKPGTPIEFFTPPNTLRAKLKTGRPTVPNPLAAAERAVNELAPEAGKWVKDEIARIDACRTAFMADPQSEDARDALLASALDVAGLAPLGGNALAARFSANLARLLADAPDSAAEQTELVGAHVDAIRASASMRVVKPASTRAAEELANELEARVQEVVAAATAA